MSNLNSLKHLPDLSPEIVFEHCVDIYAEVLSKPQPPKNQQGGMANFPHFYWGFHYHFVENLGKQFGFSMDDVRKAYEERLKIGETEWLH